MVDASVVAGAVSWIGSALIEEAKYLSGAEENVHSLQKDLVYVKQLLEDVDANPHLTQQDGQLRNFAQDIRELAFRVEDAIDSYILDAATKINRKRRFSMIFSFIINSHPVHVLIKEIEAIQQDIQNAKKRFDTFETVLKASENTGSSSSSRPPPAENYIHLHDEVVVGIDADISHLAKRLVDLEDDFRVLAIVGTGGAGKTTLATKLYNHDQVKSRFPHKAFASISQQWDRIDVLQRIYKEVTFEVEKGDEIPSTDTKLLRELNRFLTDKHCLIVLDDMWKTEAWADLCPMLPPSKKGCRVIITTRIEEVPLYADKKCVIHEPKLLTMDQKWELFSKVAMEGRVGIDKNAEFEKLGKEMLRKLEGLPLAVVTLAGVLRTKRERYQWVEVSKAVANYILRGRGKPNYGLVEDMLELSYLELATHLKPCFLYFAVFLEDWKFEADDLIGMWIAEGFVTNDINTRPEDAGMWLLDELAQRCILQVTFRNTLGQIQEFRVHDLMREFCIKKAKEYQFVGPISSTFGARQPRRTSVILPGERYPQEYAHLRSLFNLGVGVELPIGSRGDLESIPNKFKLLRVLYIWSLDYVALPDQIGILIHLRYLSIARSKIFVLPNSIRNLRNLLYLIYRTWDDADEVEVPDGLVDNMEKLRALELPMSIKRGSLKRLGLSGPKNLQRLTTGGGPWMIEELSTLSQTIRDFRIHNIQTKEEMESLYQCSSIKMGGLRRLRPKYWPWLRLFPGEDLEFDLEKLRDCTTLWDIDLDCPLVNYPRGTIIQFPPELERLYLFRSRIKEWDDLMDVLGKLPKLKALSLAISAYLGTQLSCTANGFPQLKVLQLRELDNLEEWEIEKGAMANLRDIWLDNCPKLKRLPERLRFITTLKELRITNMPEEFRRRIGYEGSTGGNSKAEDYYIIQDIPSVIVY